MTDDNFDIKKSFIEKIKDYIKQNKFLSISIIVLLLLIIILVVVYLILGQKTFSQSQGQNSASTSQTTSTVSNETTVEVLPVTQRNDEISDKYMGKDPFSSPAVLKGTVLNDKGGNLAVIEVGGSTYIVSKGDTLSDIWIVKSIKSDEVVLSKGDVETVLRVTDEVTAQQSSTN